jgi:hypothetical protein
VFDKRVLRRILGPKRDEAQWSGKHNIMRGFMIFTAHTILFGR